MSKQLSEHTKQVSEYSGKLLDLIYGGLAAISLIIIQDFISSGASDPATIIAIVAFAVGIPQLGLSLLISEAYRVSRRRKLPLIPGLVGIIGSGAALIGITAAFYHIAWYACIAFVGSGVLGIVIWFKFHSEVEG